MFKATVTNATRGRALNSLCLTAALFGIAPLAFAQTTDAPSSECGTTTPGGSGNLCDEIGAPFVATGQTCGFARGATGCTANDFVGQANVTSNTLSGCHNGDLLTNQSLSFTISSSPSTRYAAGLFIGEQNQPLNAAGGTCSVATFPTASTNPLPARDPYPWFAANVGDVCGSYSPSFTSIEQVDGVSFVCDPDVNGNLQVTFMVVYANNANGAAACTGPSDVAPGTTSKCTFGGTPVTNVVVTFNANPTCSFQGAGDGITIGDGTFTKVFTITNNGPDDAGVPDSNSVHFDDPLPAPFVVTNATCTPAGGATCPAGSIFSGNDVSGDIPTLPNGGSVTITITGTFPSGDTSPFNNVTTLSINNPAAVLPPAEWQNTCGISSTLPVRLQDFDVK